MTPKACRIHGALVPAQAVRRVHHTTSFYRTLLFGSLTLPLNKTLKTKTRIAEFGPLVAAMLSPPLSFVRVPPQWPETSSGGEERRSRWRQFGADLNVELEVCNIPISYE